MEQQPYWDKAFSLSMIHDNTQTHHTRQDFSGGVISPTQRPLPDTQHPQETSMPLAGFEPTIPASERPQTHALDRAATGIGHNSDYRLKIPGIQLRNSHPHMANSVWFYVECEDPDALRYQTPEQLNGRHGQFRR